MLYITKKPLVVRLVISVPYCRPHGCGDPSMMWNINHAEHGATPMRGRQFKGAYEQDEALVRFIRYWFFRDLIL